MAESTKTAKAPQANGKSTKHDKDKSEKSRKSKVKFGSVMPREEAVSYFEAITSGLKKGQLCLRQGENALQLSPPDSLEVEVKASSKDGCEKISFEITWSVGAESELTISST